MDQKIKNRLVGIIVLFALAVIFLPMILDGSGVKKDKLEFVIPAQKLVQGDPDFKQKIIELRSNVDQIPNLKPRFVDENSAPATLEQITTAVEQEATVVVAKKVEKVEKVTKTVKKSGGDSWVLQIGSFLDRSKALQQRDRIRKSSIAAVFIEQFNDGNKINYRVRLGPFVSREQSRVAQNKIKAKHNIDGIVMKYER
jgi:DedD protein